MNLDKIKRKRIQKSNPKGIDYWIKSKLGLAKKDVEEDKKDKGKDGKNDDKKDDQEEVKRFFQSLFENIKEVFW